MSTRTIETPIGLLTLQADEAAVTAIRFGADGAQDVSPLLDAAEAQLREYFAGTRRTFDLPLAPRGTAFQQRVWAALRAIPYGETCTYGELAAAIAPDIKAQDVTFSSGRISVCVSEQGELQSVNISCSGALHLILSDAPVSLSAVITPADRAFSIPQPALNALKQ